MWAKARFKPTVKWAIIDSLLQHGASVETSGGKGCSLLDLERNANQPPFLLRDMVRKHHAARRWALCSGSHKRLGKESSTHSLFGSTIFEPQLLPLIFQFANLQRDPDELQLKPNANADPTLNEPVARSMMNQTANGVV
jgi:hypothetical protein